MTPAPTPGRHRCRGAAHLGSPWAPRLAYADRGSRVGSGGVVGVLQPAAWPHRGHCDAVGIERPGADRTAEVAQAFVELAGALVNGYDVVDLLDRLVGHCVQLLEVDAAVLGLDGPSGALQVMVATSERARFLEVLQLHAASGPCLDCYRTGRPVNVADLAADGHRWPALAATAQHGGYRAVHAVPLAFQDQTLG